MPVSSLEFCRLWRQLVHLTSVVDIWRSSAWKVQRLGQPLCRSAALPAVIVGSESDFTALSTACRGDQRVFLHEGEDTSRNSFEKQGSCAPPPPLPVPFQVQGLWLVFLGGCNICASVQQPSFYVFRSSPALILTSRLDRLWGKRWQNIFIGISP